MESPKKGGREVRILIADDFLIVKDGHIFLNVHKSVLKREAKKYEVVFETDNRIVEVANTASNAIRKINRKNYDHVIIGLNFPLGNLKKDQDLFFIKKVYEDLASTRMVADKCKQKKIRYSFFPRHSKEELDGIVTLSAGGFIGSDTKWVNWVNFGSKWSPNVWKRVVLSI